MTAQSGRSAEAITETRRLLCSRHSGTAVVHHAMISLNEASRRYWVIVLVYSSSSLVSMIKQSEHTYVQTCCLCTQHHAASLVLGLSAGWYKKKIKKKRSVMEEGGMGEGQHSSKLVWLSAFLRKPQCPLGALWLALYLQRLLFHPGKCRAFDFPSQPFTWLSYNRFCVCHFQYMRVCCWFCHGKC